MSYVTIFPKTGTKTENNRVNSAWSPNVDIIEGDDAFSLEFDLPGYEKENINLTVKEGVLTVSGERKLRDSENGKYFSYFERPKGAFSRSFRLPDHIDAEKISSSYKNGVLAVDIKKKEEAKPYQIKIN